ncbi:hypothetical protein BD410DRAFT_765354 [Rickenella mellea]|uniref:Uncharacterized protein n=1 Tax=Rickenella mellea TaxID=50990 RepID=A0A4Y7QDK4_9AGAM|nr:hypothetical protein BD410DRAFT_765354 [Rickenella mellea]
MSYSAPPQHDIVSGEQYRYALTNFRIAHEKVEQQRIQLQEQEKQVALLRERIALLEGAGDEALGARSQKAGGSSVDDFSIKNAASKLEKLINRWAAEVIRTPPTYLNDIRDAILSDIAGGSESDLPDASPIIVQNLLRHSMAETISEGVVNCLIVTNSTEANVQLTRIHEHLFARDPTVACVWRRQTFSAAVESCSQEMSAHILSENIPSLAMLLSPDGKRAAESVVQILDAAYSFSRMLHGAKSFSGGTTDTFYRAFVPELGSMLYPRQIELVKRCMKSERGEADRVGATVFPGLVKVSQGLMEANGQRGEIVQTVVRRAQVICECALGISSIDVVETNGRYGQ